MKVLLINGSPHERGCTYTALSEVAAALEREGVGTEIVHIGGGAIAGCSGCGGCRKGGGCIHQNDSVNRISQKAMESDGFVIGSPVHYAAASGALTALLDRCFYSNSAAFAYKPAACVLSCRRAGATAAFEQLNKYFTISNMPVVSSNYWNMVHGNTPEVRQIQKACRSCILGRNMACCSKCIDGAKSASAARRASQNQDEFHPVASWRRPARRSGAADLRRLPGGSFTPSA